MFEGGVHILGKGFEPKAVAASPDSVAGAHALWELDMRALAPWNKSGAGHAEWAVESWASAVSDSVWPVLVSGPCSSSMDAAWLLADRGLLPDWGSVVAVSQNQGRGQMRREWRSPPGNLYAAWLWPGLPEAWSRLASLLAGYVLCRSLHAFEPGLRIKWPNDLMRGESKVGGVLVEERGSKLLVGFGLNLISAPSPEAMREGSAVQAGRLDALCDGFGPLGLWLRMLDPAVSELRGLLSGEIPVFLRSMERMLAWRGLQVRIKEEGDQEARGTIVGLSDDGGLRLAGDAGEQVLYSGGILPLY